MNTEISYKQNAAIHSLFNPSEAMQEQPFKHIIFISEMLYQPATTLYSLKHLTENESM